MEEKEFVNGLFAAFSNEGFVQSYKSQLRLAIHRYATTNREFSYEPYNHSFNSELICNIIANYFSHYSYKNSLNVFLEESGFHKMSEADVMRNSGISKLKTTYLDALIEKKKRQYGIRGVETQTDTFSLEAKLSQIDETVRRNRQALRATERMRMVQNQLKRIREEKEADLEPRLKHALETQKMVEMSKAKFDAGEKLRIEIERLKAEFEVILLKRSAEMKLAREHEEQSTQLLQEELDRQLQRVKTGELELASNKTMSVEEAKQQSSERLKKLLSKSHKIVKRREKLKKKLEFEKEAHRETQHELAVLQHKFATIKV